MAVGGIGQRVGPLQLWRNRGEPSRGVGLSRVGADGPPPPSEVGAMSVAQAMRLARAQATPFASNPGTQGVAGNPPRGRSVDVKV